MNPSLSIAFYGGDTRASARVTSRAVGRTEGTGLDQGVYGYTSSSHLEGRTADRRQVSLIRIRQGVKWKAEEGI